MHMSDINESTKKLEAIIAELTKHYHANPHKKSLYTLPEIFGRKHREDFISDWLAYLLDPEKNGFGMEPLIALCKYFDVDVDIETADTAKVFRENTFDNRKRIDLYIEVYKGSEKLLLIGIENKIYSAEQENQTHDYFERLRKLRKNKNFKVLLPIYLRPSANAKEAECSYFKNLFYSELKSIFESIPFDLKRDARKNFYFYEFLLYVEEVLMNNKEKLVITPDIKLYMENREAIEGVRTKFMDYAEAFTGEFANAVIKKAFGESAEFYEHRPRDFVFLQFCKKTWKRTNNSHGDFYYELLYNKTEKRLYELEDDAVILQLRFMTVPMANLYGFDNSLREKIIINLDLKSESGYEKAVEDIAEWINSPEVKAEVARIEAAERNNP